MKKIFYILFAVCLFTTCSDDDNDNQNDELVGSGWATDKIGEDTFNLYFGLDNKCTYVWKNTYFDDVTLQYYYEYKKPNLIIHRGSTGGTFATGIIEGNKMTITRDDKVFIYTKFR